MALVNRDKDTTEQVAVVVGNVVNTVSGGTYPLAVVPYPAQLVSAMACSHGLSGAPNISLWAQRMVVGVGVTSFAIGSSMASSAFGTSGAQTFTVNGLSFLLQAGDLLMLASAASNTGAVEVSVGLALKALQDIKTSFGSSGT